METKNYEAFLFKKTNRSISRQKVNSLKENIIKYGYDENYPVLITKSFEIQDGQHRFIACKELCQPIVYAFTKHEGNDYMRALNMSQSAWEIATYIESYAAEGIESYVDFCNFRMKYKNNFTNSLIIYCKNPNSTHIRLGVKLPKNPNAEQIAQYHSKFTEVPFHSKKSFVSAVIILFEKKVKEEHLNKLLESQMLIVECANSLQYLATFENIINRRMKTNQISLR